MKHSLRIPEDIKNSFFSETSAGNHRILKLLIFFIILSQAVNLIRVLALSESGLATVNNRIYFSFYCALLVISLAYMPLYRSFKDRPKVRFCLQMILCFLWLFWNAGLNLYDMFRDPVNSQNTIFLFALLLTAVCVQTVPAFFIPAFCFCGGFFLAVSRNFLEAGELLNTLFFIVIAQLIAYSRFHYILKDLSLVRTIRRISDNLDEEREKLEIILQKYRYIASENKNIVVEWDKHTDTACFYGELGRRFDIPSTIPDFTNWLRQMPFLEKADRQRLADQLAAPTSLTDGSELEVKTLSGEKQWFQLHFSFQKNADGQIASGIGYLTDISAQKQEILSLKTEVMTDPLTGLLNRRAIQNYMTVHPYLLGDNMMTVLFIIDLDNFKYVNDTYGHPCGDHVLRETGVRLKDMFRKTDAVGRLGGDEFIILLYARPNEQLVLRKARDMTKAPLMIEWKDTVVPVRFSVGIAVSFAANADYDALYRSADSALYQAKQNGKGGYVINHPDKEKSL